MKRSIEAFVFMCILLVGVVIGAWIMKVTTTANLMKAGYIIEYNSTTDNFTLKEIRG